MTPVDSSVIYALLDAGDEWHERVATWYRASETALATTPMVLAEVDHLAMARLGRAAVEAWRSDVGQGAYTIEWWPGLAGDAVEVAERYAGLGVSLTDASLAALAARLGTVDIATLDERHFRAMRPVGDDGGAFRLLPIDA